MTERPIHVLFVCLGNICRSPLAEGVFMSLVSERGLEAHYTVDSAGTGAWHVGDVPDLRSVEVARRNGVALTHRARQVQGGDLAKFDHVIAMDRENLADLRGLARAHAGDAEIELLRHFDSDPGDRQVPDPYYGGPDGFDLVYAMVRRSCAALLAHLEERRAGRGGKDD